MDDPKRAMAIELNAWFRPIIWCDAAFEKPTQTIFPNGKVKDQPVVEYILPGVSKTSPIV
jgi:hypothetical protein